MNAKVITVAASVSLVSFGTVGFPVKIFKRHHGALGVLDSKCVLRRLSILPCPSDFRGVPFRAW